MGAVKALPVEKEVGGVAALCLKGDCSQVELVSSPR